MALTGNWKAQTQVQAQASENWGNGFDPVHAIRADADGRNIAPNVGASLGEVVPATWSDEQYVPGIEYGYTYDDSVFGYGTETGTDDRPRMDTVTPEWRGDSALMSEDKQPSWGHDASGLPAGTTVRKHSHGSLLSRLIKVSPTETVSEGWEDKVHLPRPEDAGTADAAQLIMQTSMMQRDRTREGSQRSGSQSEYAAPITSRMIGPRIKPWSGGQRHYDMQPREASYVIRPWWGRSVGTGPAAHMTPNEMTVREPLTRQVPADPYQGADEPTPAAPDNYGYVSEDVIPYA